MATPRPVNPTEEESSEPKPSPATPATPARPTRARAAKPVEPKEETLTYEAARDELLTVVNRLESGGENLAEAMELFKRGEYLAGVCEQYLNSARKTVEETTKV